jgi:hypothetical protein
MADGRCETAFLVDVCQRARDRGRLHVMPGLEQRIAALKH